MQDLGLRYNSPTVALQVLPEEYAKFCKNLKEYMSYDLVPYTDFSEEHALQARHMYGCVPDYFPCALCGDIVIYFQHDTSFEVAKEKWNRRKTRIDYDHLGFIFYLNTPQYGYLAKEFEELDLKNYVIFTQGFDIDAKKYCRCDIPQGVEFLQRMPDGRRYYEGDFDKKEFLKRIRE